MPPLIKNRPGEEDKDITSVVDSKDHLDLQDESVTQEYKREIVWRNIVIMTYFHLAALYGLYLVFTEAQWKTTVAAFIMYWIGGLGITAGAHRLWAHKCYKAKFPLRMILMIFNCMAFENDIYEWSRDHRVHHKYSETDADPHNALRGFFFSHVGWLLVKKHPEVFRQGKKVDCSDLLQDPVVRFQRKHYLPLVAIFCFLIPTLVPMVLFGETWWNAFFIAGILRLVVLLNMTWLVNSAAHMWGNRPYDKHINPSENLLVTLGAIGEGFHNYHHTFPWDYRASEFGVKVNISTIFINLMAKIGWAYDLKMVSKDVIYQRKLRTGELSDHPHQH